MDDYHYCNEAGGLVLYVLQEYALPDGSFAWEDTGVIYHEDMIPGGHEAVYKSRFYP